MKIHHKLEHGKEYPGRYQESICDICESTFEYDSWRFEGVYCSMECAHQSARQVQRVEHIVLECRRCGDIFQVIPANSDRVYCSKECYWSDRSDRFCGEDNPSWTENPAPQHRGGNWRKVRRKVIQRDGRECQKCGANESESPFSLEVHHIVPFREFDDSDQANKLKNLVTLCKSCHSLVENSKVGCPEVDVNG
jgi:hypothetical protein